MRAWWRYLLIILALLLLGLAGVAWWLVQGFDSERVKRIASDWMLTYQDRTLVFDGPVRLQLWPQPAVAVQRVRLSEPGEPGEPEKPFATIDKASLSLHLYPLLSRREIEIDSVAAQGLKLHLRRGKDGRRNIDDLLGAVAGEGGGGGDAPRPERAVAIEQLRLADIELQIDDRLAGVQGRLVIPKLELGAFGPGLRSPLQLQAQAELQQPRLSATLQLQGGLQLLPAPQPGAAPIVQLTKSRLHLRGNGFKVEKLDALVQAESLDLEVGEQQGSDHARADLQGLKLRFSGQRQGWQIDQGELQLARLQFDMAQRQLELKALALHVKGQREAGTIDATLNWPELSVQGDRLQGGAVEGELRLGGAQPLKLQLRSSAPHGNFERISLPGLHLDIDGRRAGSALQGQADGTLVIEPNVPAATLDAMKLRLRLDDPSLAALRIALDAQAWLTPESAAGQLTGTLNDQRVDAQLDLQFGGQRPSLDLRARFATLDLDRFTVPPQRGTATAPTPAADAMRVDLAPLRQADARLDIQVERLLRAPYRVDALQLRAAIDNGVLDLRRATGRAWGGSFDASGRANAGNGRIDLRLRADSIDVRALLADTLGYDGLQGRGNFEADLQTRGATVGALRAALNGTARLSLQPAALRGVDLAHTLRDWRSASSSGSDVLASSSQRSTDFSQLQGSFVVRNGVARNDDLDARSEFLRISGEGTVDLAQERVDYVLRTRVVNTASGRAGPEMMLLNGVTVPVQLNGPFGQVAWQVNWATVTAAVAALSVPNVVRGAAGTAVRGAAGVVRGAGRLLGAIPGAAAASAPR